MVAVNGRSLLGRAGEYRRSGGRDSARRSRQAPWSDNELEMAVLLDSGFLFASLNASEVEHASTIRVLESIREPIVLPVPAITEVAYLLAREPPGQ